MEALKKEQKHSDKLILILCNIALIAVAVLFTIWYSGNIRITQEELMRSNFCNTVDTMRQIAERYLSGELESAAAWGAYIQDQNMTMDEALDYIRTISSQDDCEAHIVDMDTYEAWSTKFVGGSNIINAYQRYYNGEIPRSVEYVEQIQKMFAGEKYVLGKYKLTESQRTVISVGLPVSLRQDDGSSPDYLLLRVVPVERMKALWLFPINYSAAEIGLVAPNGDYVIPSKSMRSGNFMDFVRAYNFPDDYYAADSYLAQMKTQSSGLLVLNDSKGQPCYWYYSRLDGFADLDILGYIPVDALSAEASNLSIVIVVAGILLLLVIIDGAYILNINRQLRVTARVADRANSAKTQFLSTMSHDIRTPLNAVLGMTELAQSHIDDTSYVRECLRKISVSGNHLLTLINDILEISRVESGKISLNPTPFDVQEFVANLESITRSQAVGRGLDFTVSLAELPEPYLVGDKLRLTQIYLNLLNNAVKYTNPGGSVRLEIREKPNDDGGGVILVGVVSDTGTGMSPEFQKTMYDSFTRVADSRIDKIQGTGLGLAIVKRMVTLMDGSVDCVSTEGTGTTFTIRIPLIAAPASALAHTEHSALSEATHDLAGVSVLVAEDNDINWEIISEMLRDQGFLCERAENGRVCVDRLLQSPPDTFDLVLMDVQMPVLNGRDATRVLRASDRADLRVIPVIAMTADAFAEDVQLCMDAGMDAHVAKPVEIDKVLAAIRLLLSRKNNADERQS